MIQGEVLQKYAPKYGADEFFCRLVEPSGYTLKAMIHESHYSTFDVGDVVSVDGHVRDSWLRVHGVTVVSRATPEIQDLEVELGYVSDPKRIGDDLWYLAKVGDNWFRISYSIASKYWLGNQAATDGAFRSSYYELLGVDDRATVQEIHRAWRKAARQHHPDLFPPEQRDYQGQVMTRVNAAHDCLMDADERARYDVQLAAPTQEQTVKAWPGRGFGTLRCLAEVRGDSRVVTKIISWANREVEFVGSVPVRDLRLASTGLCFEVGMPATEMYAATERLVVGWEHLPTRDWSRYDVPGDVQYRIKAIRTGHWDWRNKQVVRQLRVREATFEWPLEF